MIGQKYLSKAENSNNRVLLVMKRKQEEYFSGNSLQAKDFLK